MEYRGRYVTAALKLADLVATSDVARSSTLAEEVLAVAPETDLAYERLIRNARLQADDNAVRRLSKRYEAAAARHGFPMNPYLLREDGASTPKRAAR